MSSVTFCKRELKMGQNAVVDWSNYLREVCVWKLKNNYEEIGGPSLIVKIDESLFVRRKNNIGFWLNLCEEHVSGNKMHFKVF
jgi:hypothetical protein